MVLDCDPKLKYRQKPPAEIADSSPRWATTENRENSEILKQLNTFYLVKNKRVKNLVVFSCFNFNFALNLVF